MTQLKKHLLILFLLLSSLFLRAQEKNQNFYKFPLKVAIGNQIVGFPYQNLFQAINPSFSLGTELGLNKNSKHHLFLAANLGFINNKVIGDMITLGVDFGYRYTHKKGLFIEGSLGMGLLSQFHPRPVYEQNETTGIYEKVTDNGTLASFIGFNTGIGYDFTKKTKYPFRLGLTHYFFIQTTYFDIENFSIMPQSTTSIVLTYKFKKQ